MPQSRGRRPARSRQGRQRRRTAQRRSRSATTGRPGWTAAEVSRWTTLLSDVAADEARHDATAALARMRANLVGPDGCLFWRVDHLVRLRQLTELADVLPSWVYSRWVLAQAHETQAPGALSRTRQCVALTADLYPGDAPVGEAECVRLLENDWVFRQLLLYDHGGLDFFVRTVARADLVARADDLGRWAAAPMGGYRLIGTSATRLRWRDLADGVEHLTANLGGGIVVGDGHHAIGRLVPTGQGLIFESRPQPVDEETAVAVARDPGNWLAALRDGLARYDTLLDRADDPDDILGGLACDDYEGLSDLRNHEPTLTTDAVPVSWTFALLEDAPAGTSIHELTGVAQGRAVLTMARRLLSSDDRQAATAATTTGTDAPHRLFSVDERWACLAALLTQPAVYGELSCSLGAADRDVLAALASRIAEPAAGVCRMLTSREADAA